MKIQLFNGDQTVSLSRIWLPLTTLQLHITHGLQLPSFTALRHTHIHHCTNYTAVTNLPWLSCHTCTSFTHPHISSTLPYTRCEVLFCPGWHSERFPCFLIPCVYLDYSDRLLPALLTLPACWYLLCLLPAPTFALSLLLILPSLHYSCYCLWPLPVWHLVRNKAAIGSNLTASSLHSYCN